jgi:soluble lytic murein transglycosylase-like protein
MKPRRVPFTVSATMLFLTIAFNSTPSDTALPDPMRIPDPPPEHQALRDLARWVAQSRLPDRRFHAVTPGDLDSALSLTPRRLGLSSEAGEAARRELLVDLPYGSEIWRAAQRRRVDGLLVAAIVEAESGFTPDAVSSRGAVGLMQLLPATGQLYGATDLQNPYVNLDVGSRYLAWLLREFDGDPERAVAAYNAGPATVVRYGGVPPFRETRAYVHRVLELYRERSEAAWQRAGFGRDPFVALPVPAGS